jgi:cytochrome P450
MRRDPLSVLAGLASYGDIACLRIGPQRIYLVSDPELVREVLVTQGRSFMKGRALQEAKRLLGEGLLTSEGELHLRQRRLVQPLFHQERIASYGEAMVDYAARAASRWSDGEALDVAEEMTRLTLAVVGKTIFDADVEGDTDEVGEALTTAMEAFDRFMLPWAGILERLPLPASRRFRSAVGRLDAIVERMIEERRRDPEGRTRSRHPTPFAEFHPGDASVTRTDLLSLLLTACDETDGARMSPAQVRDEAMTIFLAGHETTAQALTWTWFLLSRYPEVEARLHAELDRALGGRLPRVADLPSLTYAKAVVSESMRLYPPAWVIGRRALRDVQLGGYRIPAGSIVAVSPFVVHRDPRWWPEPERFDPQRWLDGSEEGRPRYAYFPFGGGARMCIGERFAWMEAVLIVAAIASTRRLRLVPGYPVELAPSITLRPRHGLRMTVAARR